MDNLAELFAAARNNQQSGNFTRAEELLKQVLRSDPHNADVLCYLGINAFQTSRPQLAVEYLTNAIAVERSNPAYYYFRGASYQALRKPAEAAESFREALRIKPDYAEAHNDLGIAFATQGMFEEAAKSFQEAVRLKPADALSHSNLASALRDLGHLDEAVAIYREAVRLKPDYAEAYLQLGITLTRQGKQQEASTFLDRAARLKPDNAEWHFMLANVQREQGKFDEAIASYRQAIKLKPDHTDAYNNLGLALGSQGKLDEAVSCYERVIWLRPDYALAYNNLGNVLRDQGKFEEAITRTQQVLRFKPDYAEAHNNLGVTYARQGRVDEAVASFREAVSLKPGYAEAHNNLGIALRDQGKLEDAVSSCREAVRLRPEYADAYYSLGNALRDLDRFDEAAASFEQAVALKPESVESRNNLGIVYEAIGRLDDAIAQYDQVLRIKPDYVESHYNWGLALVRKGQLDEAIQRYDSALRLRPDSADMHRSRAMALLLKGDFEQGFTEFEWRWGCSDTIRPPFEQPPWDGSPLAGRTILLHAEQGLGDTVQFIRFAPHVKARGARVLLQCQPPVKCLLSGCAGFDQLIVQGEAIPPFDVHAPLMSLPRLLGITLTTIPAERAYIEADAGLIEKWRQDLRSSEGLKVGISWQGNPKYKGDRQRSIPLVQFAPLTEIEGLRLFSLQKGPGTEQIREAVQLFPLTDLGPQLDESTGPFMDTAAVMKNLDLVVTSDTAVAHLAGALGVPVWVALNYSPDWRFLLERQDSPWYPTMRLFRQTEFGNWEDVFNRITDELATSFGVPRRMVQRTRPAKKLVTTIKPLGAAPIVSTKYKPTISIITPWRDHPELISDYERSVGGAQVIVIDNASRPDCAAEIRAMVERCGAVYLRNDVNTGFAAANNQGLSHATGDIVLFLNNDVAAEPGFLDCVARDVSDGVVAGPSLQRQLVYGLWLPYLEGWCIAARRDVWIRLHGWDADAYPGPYWEDNDLCFRAQEAGFPIVHRGWPIRHKQGQTTTSVERWGDSFERNRATFAGRVRELFERRRQQKRLAGDEEPVVVPHASHATLRKTGSNGGMLATRYYTVCTDASDINEHCPTLYALAKECRHITEMGTRRGLSTIALLFARPNRLVCYDTVRYPQVDELQELANGTDFSFHQADVLNVDIEPTDLLFIDTIHVYDQLRQELDRHGDKARKYIILHDTTTYADQGELEGSKGIWSAVEEFLSLGTFRIKQHFTNNNGLTVLQRLGSAESNGGDT